MDPIDILVLIAGLTCVGFGLYYYAKAERLQTALDRAARELRGAEERAKYLKRARDQLLLRQRVKEENVSAVENSQASAHAEGRRP